MGRRALHKRYGRATHVGHNRYEVTVGGNLVYRGDSSQKAHAVFKRAVAHARAHGGGEVFLRDHFRDDEPIREFRKPFGSVGR